MVWAFLAFAVLGVAAVLIFGVPGQQAVRYGFLALMLFGRLSMHGGHGPHAGHSDGSEDRRFHGGCH